MASGTIEGEKKLGSEAQLMTPRRIITKKG
jgi:hypothetical protein